MWAKYLYITRMVLSVAPRHYKKPMKRWLRELEFLRLTRNPDNWPYPYIAACMQLKLPTLHYLRRKIFDKLGVKSRTALMLKVQSWSLG